MAKDTAVEQCRKALGGFVSTTVYNGGGPLRDFALISSFSLKIVPHFNFKIPHKMEPPRHVAPLLSLSLTHKKHDCINGARV